MMQKPTFRQGTLAAMEALSKALNIPFDDTMQDWAYTVYYWACLDSADGWEITPLMRKIWAENALS